MPNLVGIGLSQVPTNSMLGGLAYQSPDHASIKDLDLKNLSQINSEIADTAVDVFIYDTRKDSDGGAWRKRTQYTSWYNETLNTATRGSRREFPSVAVIVVETTKITIYDGDDPDLPMWMVFNQNSTGSMLNSGASNTKKISALNGIFAWTADYDAHILYFLTDKKIHKQDGNTFQNNGDISQRNSNNGYTLISTLNPIVNRTTNDVAMTVLPNAPIDETTGLPVPTIAVATNGGVSVIRDDGTVVDITHWGSSGYNETDYIEFFENDLVFCMDSVQRELFKLAIPSSDLSLPVAADVVITTTSGRANAIRVSNTIVNMSTSKVTSDGITAAVGSNGIAKVLDAPNYSTTLSSGITTSYNTGYMVGDIKGAFLSDTDTTNVTGTEFITNGTFDTDSDWEKSSHWTISGGSASMPSTSTYLPLYQYNLGLTAGVKYVASIDVSAISGQVKFDTARSGGDGIDGLQGVVFSTTGTHSFYFTAESDQDGIGVARQVGHTSSCTIDNITVKKVVEDRSLYNKGLKVFGTITKSPVATGAELVSYSGWSSSNYLRQPYNSDLDFGTGDWCYMFWYNPNDAESGDVIFSRWSYNVDSVSAPRIQAYFNSGNLRVDTSDASAGTAYQGHVGSDGTQDSNEWHCAVILRRGPNLEIWIDGENYKTGSLNSNSDGSYTKTNAIIEIGSSPGGGSAEAGLELALFRVSGTAPSAEQIKKMYEDEKVLFQENAKATLYGSSDAVTALGYDEDTELLHVGTSSGRSDFQGLRRINNTTTAVTTAISASDDLIAEQ